MNTFYAAAAFYVISMMILRSFAQETASILVTGSYKQRHQSLVSLLSSRHSPDVIPSSGQPLNVSLDLFLLNILEADPDQNQVEMVAQLQKHYRDEDLAWDQEVYGLSKVFMRRELIWSPDLAFTNNIGTCAHQPENPVIVEVLSDGTVKFTDTHRIRIPCELDLLASHHVAGCDAIVASLLHDRSLLWLDEPTEGTGSGVLYSPASKYILTSISAQKETGHYTTGEFEDMIFTVNFGRIPE